MLITWTTMDNVPRVWYISTKAGVEKYQNQFSWLRDAKFLQDLENDSVDSEIIEEELSALQEEENPTSKRQKLVKCLQSNPVQILLFIVVLLDAGIVIAQLILDLNSIKARMHKREEQVSQLVHLIENRHPSDLCDYNGTDFEYILSLLQDENACLKLAASGKPRASEPRNSSVDYNTYSNTNLTSSSEELALFINANNSSKLEAMQEPRNRTHGIVRRSSGQSSSAASYGCDEDDDGCVPHVRRKIHFDDEHDPLREIAHGLHFASIAILAFLVLEDFVKIAAMGKDFFKHKVDVLDAIIIVSSLIMDIVFLNGVTGEEGQKAVAILVVLLLWRIARVTDGIMITVKQRQEFRIRLQKRARRNAERKIDILDEERHVRVRQIQSLKDLCSKAGVREEEVEACAPRRGPRRISTTMCALSSVARLSVSMTMSMSSGLFSVFDDDQFTEKAALDKNFNSANNRGDAILMGLPEAAYSPKWTRRKSEGNLFFSPQSSRRKTDKTSSGEKARGSASSKADGPSPRVKKKKRGKAKEASPVQSPVNSSGVKIVISQGSDSETSTTALDDEATSEGAAESFLSVEAANAFSDDKKVSNMSQVFLLSEIR